MNHSTSVSPWLVLALVLAAVAARSQDRPAERQTRSYIPHEQLVSFSPSTPFNQAVDVLNPLLSEYRDQTLVDPRERTHPIGVRVEGQYYMDALELILERHRLALEGSNHFLVIQRAEEEGKPTRNVRSDTSERGAVAERVASLASREIRIDAVLFEVNVDETEERGINWNALFRSGQGSGGGGGGSSGGSGGSGGGTLQIKARQILEEHSDYLTGPERANAGVVMQLLRFFETEGLGQTIANPSVTVQSEEEGHIQIGSDLPVQIRDFAGNTTTEFVSTGIIINVVPTLIRESVADSAGAPVVDFIHLDVAVENSSGRPSPEGVIVDKSETDTQVLLLDGEQTVIGGLYSTDKTTERRGVPVLKDLPPWFFGLRYVFGFSQTTTTTKELIIILQAQVVDSVRQRARLDVAGDTTDLVEEQRRALMDRMDRIDGAAEKFQLRLPEDP